MVEWGPRQPCYSSLESTSWLCCSWQAFLLFQKARKMGTGNGLRDIRTCEQWVLYFVWHQRCTADIFNHFWGHFFVTSQYHIFDILDAPAFQIFSTWWVFSSLFTAVPGCTWLYHTWYLLQIPPIYLWRQVCHVEISTYTWQMWRNLNNVL